MASFGELLAELRQDKKLTQDQLAKELFVTAGTISNYENSVHFPDVEKLLAIADYFNVTTDYLLGRSSCNLPLDVLDEQLFSGITAGNLIEDFRNLPADRKRALQIIIKDMKVGMMINQYSKRENT